MIIAFTGRDGAGKTTAAKVAEEMGFRRERFAGALKAMIGALLAYQGVDAGTIERMIDGDLKEVPSEHLGGRTPRYAQQTLGDWGRNVVHPRLWADGLERRLDLISGDVAIDDARKPEEIDVVKRRGGLVVRVTRPDLPPLGPEPHITELGHLLPADVGIENSGTLHDLRVAVQQMVGGG